MANAKMSLSEVMNDMRRRGCKISYGSLVSGADSGAYPFIKLLRVSENGRRTNLILRCVYERWAEEHLGGYMV
jgi:hypothetical protein